MKIFHDHDENDSWTEITTIKKYPIIRTRMDETSQISFVLNDFEGALFSTWEGYNFIPIKVEDDSANVLFRGYLTGKKFTHNELSCVCHGFSIRLDWVPLDKNYILSQGIVKTVPYAGSKPGSYTVVIRPGTDDIDHSWSAPVGTAWSTVDDDVLTGQTGTRGINEQINTENGDANAVCSFKTANPTFETGTAVTTSITVHWEGEEDAGIGGMQVDISWDDGANWSGSAQEQNMIPGWTWYSKTWSGLSKSEADMNQFAIKFIADAAVDATHNHRVSVVYAVATYYLEEEFIELETNNEGLLGWTPDQWHELRDTGIIIRDNTQNLSSETWSATAVAFTGADASSGVFGSLNDLYVNNIYAYEDSPADFYIIPTISDAVNVIADTQTIHSIEITVRFGCANTTFYPFEMALQVDNDGNWEAVPQAWSSSQRVGLGGSELTTSTYEDHLYYKEETYTITTDPANHLSKTGTDYTSIKGIRFHCEGGGDGGGIAWKCFGVVDYISCKIIYYPVAISPIEEKILDNGEEWVRTAMDFGSYGVTEGDTFVIGTSTAEVLHDLMAEAQIAYLLPSTTSKYIAQHLKGTYCKEQLKRMCLLEGMHWFEDHLTEEIIVAKEADFVDSTEDFTSANYAYDWEFEDDNNYYGAVKVFGSSSLNIKYTARDNDIDSPRIKTIIEETITTTAEAKNVADAQLSELKTKRPSIKIPIDGVNTNLQIGKTVGLTMERPTIGADDYPIRMIEREKFGGGIRTTIYCGLGHSTPQERIADTINKIAYLTHKAHTDRLISTPYEVGASFNWSDIGGGAAGAVAAVLADDKYIKNYENDATTGNLTVANLITAGNVDGVDVSEIPATINCMGNVQVYNGTLQGVWHGRVSYMNLSDDDAGIRASFYVENGGSFKVRFIFAGTQDNDGEISSGLFYISEQVESETSAWNLENADNLDLTLGDTGIIMYQDSDAYTIPDDARVGVQWQKDTDDTAVGGNPAGLLMFYGFMLVRQ